MTGDWPEPAAARNRLAGAQIELVAALIAGAPPPPGFDPVRLRAQADALVAKRREVVAKLRPDLVRAAGAQFRDRFDTYALAHPRPIAGARADAEAFARTLPGARPNAERVALRTRPGRLVSRLY